MNILRRNRRTVDSQPLVLVFALGELHHLAKAPAAECCLCILAKLVARGTTFTGYSRSELVLRPGVASESSSQQPCSVMSHCLRLGVDNPWWVSWAADVQDKAMRWLRWGRGRGTIAGFPLRRCRRQQDSTHTVVRNELMARTRGLGSRKNVGELRPPDQGNALAGLSLMTQALEQLHRRSRGRDSGEECAPIQAES